MVDAMKLHLENMGPINEADIVIDKITVVGGHNSTGKSTLSKFLYSFLRSNTINRQEIAYKTIVNLMKNHAIILKNTLAGLSLDHDFVNPELFDLKNLEDYDKILEYYSNMKISFYKLKYNENEYDDQYRLSELNKDFEIIDNLIYIVTENSHDLYISLMRKMLSSEFPGTDFNSIINIKDINNLFEFSIDFKNHNFDNDEAFNSKSRLMINNVYYIDSISVLDVFERGRLLNRKSDHLEFLRKNLIENYNSSDIFDKQINKNIIELENEVNEIINGKFIYERGEFKFISDNNIKSDIFNTASGTKQVGIIQLLLSNRKLNKNSFLIIDEPEVNLHPEWQIKLAEILVLLSKKLDVNIYINTHSPMFIESMSLYSKYYDLLNQTNFYLTEKHAESGFFFNKIDSNDMGSVYENLSRPYDDLDDIKSKIIFKD